METQRLKDAVTQAKDQTVQALEDATGKLKVRAQEWSDRTGKAVREAGTAADHYVHEHTWSSIALAAVLGCVIGVLLGRGRD